MRHVEGFKLVMQLFGLPKCGSSPMQMQIDAGSSLLKRAFVAEQAALRKACGKIKGLFSGEQIACGDEHAKRWNTQMEQPAR